MLSLNPFAGTFGLHLQSEPFSLTNATGRLSTTDLPHNDLLGKRSPVKLLIRHVAKMNLVSLILFQA